MNQFAVDLIRKYEGLRLIAYYCPGGFCTIGYGHTGPDVKPGMTITKERAEQLLQLDLAKFEPGVASLVKVKLTQAQLGALVSFAYNVGIFSFEKSTLLKKINAHDPTAADEFLKWDKVDSQVLKGLAKRRAAERELFLKG